MLRRMKEGDIGEILFIENTSFSQPWTYQMFKYELTNPIAYFFVYEHRKQIIGYSGMWRVMDEIDIANIAVRSEYRKHGVGKFLLSNIIETARTLGILKMTLEVRPSNTSALTLYKNLGFIESGRRPRYYDDGEDAIIMWRYEQGVNYGIKLPGGVNRV